MTDDNDWRVSVRLHEAAKAGQAVEAGTHDELMSANGRYAELFTLQASAYR